MLSFIRKPLQSYNISTKPPNLPSSLFPPPQKTFHYGIHRQQTLLRNPLHVRPMPLLSQPRPLRIRQTKPPRHLHPLRTPQASLRLTTATLQKNLRQSLYLPRRHTTCHHSQRARRLILALGSCYNSPSLSLATLC